MEFDVVNFTELRNIYNANAIRETPGTQSTANNVWVTLVSISGKGMIYAMAFSRNASATSAQWRVTIDGGTPTVIPFSTIATPYNSNNRMTLPLNGVRFDTSVLIEYTQSAVTSYASTGSVTWGER